MKNLYIYVETSIPGRADPLPQALEKVFVENNPKEEVDLFSKCIGITI